jgi:hypothetical protein
VCWAWTPLAAGGATAPVLLLHVAGPGRLPALPRGWRQTGVEPDAPLDTGLLVCAEDVLRPLQGQSVPEPGIQHAPGLRGELRVPREDPDSCPCDLCAARRRCTGMKGEGCDVMRPRRAARWLASGQSSMCAPDEDVLSSGPKWQRSWNALMQPTWCYSRATRSAQPPCTVVAAAAAVC